MRRLLLALALVAAPLAAQDVVTRAVEAQQKKAQEPRVQRLFLLKYADPNQVASLLRVFTEDLRPDTAMHALAVSASPETMSAIEEAIKRLDVPSAVPQNIELALYLMVGAQGQSAQPAVDLPKDLESVVVQLRNAFTYKSYRLMDTINLRTRTGQEAQARSTSGSVAIGQNNPAVITQFRIGSATVGSTGAIRINGMRLSSRVPVATGGAQSSQFQYMDLGLNTDLDIKEGQKLVVGKMGMSGNDALFVVLMARAAQ